MGMGGNRNGNDSIWEWEGNWNKKVIPAHLESPATSVRSVGVRSMNDRSCDTRSISLLIAVELYVEPKQ